MARTIRKSTVTRRRLMQRAGAAFAAAGVLANPHGVHAQNDQADRMPTMRSPQTVGMNMQGGLPALPPLGVIAFNRAAFGPQPGDLNRFAEMGGDDEQRLAEFVAEQLNPDAIDDSACDALIAAQGFTTLDKSLTQLWTEHALLANTERVERIRPFTETEQATWLRAVYSKRQLVEVLADFWHNHFNIYGLDHWAAPVWAHYDRSVIRGHLLGNFRALLGAVVKSPAMLYYLDNTSNTAAGPNENFARELFELHTLGAENYLGVVGDRSQVPVDEEGRPVGYIDKDVYQATECFTGWTIDRETGDFVFDESRHSPYEKIVLNTLIDDFQGQQDGEIVLDLLANHPGTARHIAGKLCRRLISDEPPESVVQAAADVFHAQRSAPDQLAQVVGTILLSDEFRTTWGTKIKRPFEYAVSVLRACSGDLKPDSTFLRETMRMGQPLFQWKPPNGYPDTRTAWAGTTPMLYRWRYCNWAVDWAYAEGPNADKKRLPIADDTPADRRTPNQIVDFWSQRILGRDLPPEERVHIVEFMAQGRNPDFDLPDEDIQERTRYMVALMMMSPAFLWR